MRKEKNYIYSLRISFVNIKSLRSYKKAIALITELRMNARNKVNIKINCIITYLQLKIEIKMAFIIVSKLK